MTSPCTSRVHTDQPSEEIGTALNSHLMAGFVESKLSNRVPYGSHLTKSRDELLMAAGERAEKERRALEYLKDLTDEEDRDNVIFEKGLRNFNLSNEKDTKNKTLKEKTKILARHSSLPITPVERKPRKSMDSGNQSPPMWQNIELLDSSKQKKTIKLGRLLTHGQIKTTENRLSPTQDQVHESNLKEDLADLDKSGIRGEVKDAKETLKLMVPVKSLTDKSYSRSRKDKSPPPEAKMDLLRIPENFRSKDSSMDKKDMNSVVLQGKSLSLPKFARSFNEMNSRPSTNLGDFSRRLDVTLVTSSMEEMKDSGVVKSTKETDKEPSPVASRIIVTNKIPSGKGETMSSALVTKAVKLLRSRGSQEDVTGDVTSLEDEEKHRNASAGVSERKKKKKKVKESKKVKEENENKDKDKEKEKEKDNKDKEKEKEKEIEKPTEKEKDKQKEKEIEKPKDKEKEKEKEKERVRSLPPLQLTKLHPSKFTKQTLPKRLEAQIQGKTVLLARLERKQTKSPQPAEEPEEASPDNEKKEELKNTEEIMNTIELPPISLLKTEIQLKNLPGIKFQDSQLTQIYRKSRSYGTGTSHIRTKSISNLVTKRRIQEDALHTDILREFSDTKLLSALEEYIGKSMRDTGDIVGSKIKKRKPRFGNDNNHSISIEKSPIINSKYAVNLKASPGVILPYDWEKDPLRGLI